MSIFDKSENEKYLYFLVNFKEILADWLVIVRDSFIKASLDEAMIKLLGMNLDKAFAFYQIDIEHNPLLLELSLVSEKYGMDYLEGKNMLDEFNKKTKDVLTNEHQKRVIDAIFEDHSQTLNFMEIVLNVVTIAQEDDGVTIEAWNNYKSKAFMKLPLKIKEMLEWFEVDIQHDVVNHRNVWRLVGLKYIEPGEQERGLSHQKYVVEPEQIDYPEPEKVIAIVNPESKRVGLDDDLLQYGPPLTDTVLPNQDAQLINAIVSGYDAAKSIQDKIMTLNQLGPIMAKYSEKLLTIDPQTMRYIVGSIQEIKAQGEDADPIRLNKTIDTLINQSTKLLLSVLNQ